MTEKYGLKPSGWSELVGWRFADDVFGCDWDVMSDVTKSRHFGFHDVGRLGGGVLPPAHRFRGERVVP
jgi:hypothetical protein